MILQQNLNVLWIWEEMRITETHYISGVLSVIMTLMCYFSVWSDIRTNTTLDRILQKKTHNKDKNYLKNMCGLPLSPYFSALKLCWLIENVPEVKKAIEENRCLFGTIDSWLIWVRNVL